MTTNIGYAEAVDLLVAKHMQDPGLWIDDIYFKEGGEWFELKMIPEVPEMKHIILGYVSVRARGGWVDSCEFDLEKIDELKEWVSEAVWGNLTE